jgi:hypothetical protein
MADSELKTNAASMQCFFVLVTNGQFDSASGEIKHNAQLHTLAARGDNQACKDSMKKHTEAIRAFVTDCGGMNRAMLD